MFGNPVTPRLNSNVAWGDLQEHGKQLGGTRDLSVQAWPVATVASCILPSTPVGGRICPLLLTNCPEPKTPPTKSTKIGPECKRCARIASKDRKISGPAHILDDQNL